MLTVHGKNNRHIKKLPQRLEQEVVNHPEQQVEVWVEDEHRVGLQPIVQREWVDEGYAPMAMVKPRYQWTYVYGFAHPETGRTYWLILPTCNLKWFTLALKHFAQAVGAGLNKRIILVLDQAGWHLSPKVKVPEGVVLEFLPAYSPELQPAERLWPLVDEALANRVWATIEAVEECLEARCCSLSKQMELLKRYLFYHWWPRNKP
jgi:hypothetical protein